jgi:hemoglobin-like flavoprotein
MTKEEIELVKDSWKTLRGVDPRTIGEVFYAKLFLDAPNLRHMFPSDMREQSGKVFKMLNIVVSRLHKLDELQRDIEALAIRHKEYGVKTAHYELVGSALMWTLDRAFGMEWKPMTEEAWRKCYTTLSSTMIKAAKETTAL